uniref:ABC transmembrane type-1 domain-containing protein n=1 Tax=Ditylenchus dipsaci TaxID=166011 RepID=A0A915DH60_9BILA
MFWNRKELSLTAQKPRNAKIVQQLSSEPLNMKATVDIRFYQFVGHGTAFISLFIIALFFSWQITLTGLLVFCVLCAILVVLAKNMQKQLKIVNDVDDSAKIAVEIIENVRTIQLLTKEAYFLQKYFEKLHATMQPLIKAAIYDALMFSITQSFMYVSDLFCFGVGVYLVYNGLNRPSEAFV